MASYQVFNFHTVLARFSSVYLVLARFNTIQRFLSNFNTFSNQKLIPGLTSILEKRYGYRDSFLDDLGNLLFPYTNINSFSKQTFYFQFLATQAQRLVFTGPILSQILTFLLFFFVHCQNLSRILTVRPFADALFNLSGVHGHKQILT